MFETIIVICLYFISTYIIIKHINDRPDRKTLCSLGTLMCIQAPLLEESFFRGILKQLLCEYEYSIYITSIIFGVYHMINCVFISDKKLLIFQLPMATYMGYYLYQFDNIWHAIAVHCLYNTCVFLTFLFSIKYLIKEEPVKSYIPLRLNDFDRYFTCSNITMDDWKISLNHKPIYWRNSFKRLKRGNIPKDILERIDKLGSLHGKREMRLFKPINTPII